MILKNATVVAVVLCALISAVSAKGVSNRPRTSTRYKRSSDRRRQAAALDEKCKYLLPKAGKGKGSSVRARAVRRGAAVPQAFVQQEVETVYFDTPTVTTRKGKSGKGAPKGFEWIYGDDGKKPNPAYDYIECEAPSAQPSTSTSPSERPSNRPTTSPSDSPSSFPSITPSISHQPSVSQQPSLSVMPSSGPTIAGSPGCAALEKNSLAVYKDASTTVEFTYDDDAGYQFQMIYSTSESEDELLIDVNDLLQEFLSGALIFCPGSDSRRQMSAFSSRALMADYNPDVVIDGISMNGPDTEVTTKECDDETQRNMDSNTSICKVFYGDFTAYVRKDESSGDARTGEEVVRKHIISKIESAMTAGFADAVPGVVKTVYGGGLEKMSNGEVSGLGRNAPDDSSGKEHISLTGGFIMGLGVMATLIFLFAATRKREHHKLQRVEELLDDDESIFGKSGGRGTDTMSNGSSNWKYERGAHVLGEDDSVYSGLDGDDIVNDIKNAERHRLYGMGSHRTHLGPQEDNLGARGESLDVHNCTSATCPICTRAESPRFVNSDLLSPVQEVSPKREVASPRTPSYSNTVDVDMAERHYMSPDTVEM